MSFEATKRNLEDAAAFIIIELAQELRKQRHEASGSGIRSLNFRIVQTGDGIKIEFRGNRYLIVVNEGRRPGEFVPIRPLIKWIIRKGISAPNKTVRQLAYAISTTIMKEGSPTKGSRQNGPPKKTGFIDIVVEKNIQFLENEAQKSLDREIQIVIDKNLKVA